MSQILLIEDDPFYREFLQAILTEGGFTVHLANNGREGLRLCQSQKIDLVITDIIMPEMDGLETILELGSSSHPTPIIAISGGGPLMPAQLNVQMAEKLGAATTLEKPIVKEDLLDAVHKLLAAPS